MKILQKCWFMYGNNNANKQILEVWRNIKNETQMITKQTARYSKRVNRS